MHPDAATCCFSERACHQSDLIALQALRPMQRFLTLLVHAPGPSSPGLYLQDRPQMNHLLRG